MAKQLIRTYVFTPNQSKIEILGNYDLSQILIVTNVTRNVILYNFADPAYAGTTTVFNRENSASFPRATQTADGTTTINLMANTTGMLASDDLQIFVERAEVITRPWPMGTDAFERTRMAAPKSMLDADFEYGLQPTKWQTIDLNRGTPAIFEQPGSDLIVNGITTNFLTGRNPNEESIITVTCATPHNLTTSSVVVIQNVDNNVFGYARTTGKFLVQAAPTPTTFTYYAKQRVGSGLVVNESLLTSYTTVRKGNFYTNAGQSPTFSYSNASPTTTATITLQFSQPHGFVPGTSILVSVSSDNGSNNHALAQGSSYVEDVPTIDSLRFSARTTGTITGVIVGTVYARSDAFYVHRPFDGGVSLGAGGPNYGSMAVRMSKKYIRYQSGKAVNYNTAALFSPNYDLNSVTATNTTVGSNIYITTDDVDHGLQAGSVIGLSGITSSGYNGNYTVSTVIDENTIIVTATNALSTTTAVLGSPSVITHQSWHGAVVRAGTFDDQNGIFWQYDGQRLAVGLRSSTFQIAGTVTVTPGSNLMIGRNTRFRDQIATGDRVVVKGMSHVVTHVTSATWVYVNPPYRGALSTAGAKMTKTNETLVPQPQWNMDRCDGSSNAFNPSGYYIDPSKIQMIGLQWTWYGAGFIDWLIRGSDGNYMTVHRMKQNNSNYEAYMRSGNMPVRYEIQNEGPRSILARPLSNSDTTLYLTDASWFPNDGTVYIDNEFINYTSRNTATNTLSGLQRAASVQQYAAGSLRTFTAGGAVAHTSSTGVIVTSVRATPTISHWGSAFITDGGFDEDRGYIFNYQSTNIQLTTRKTTAFAIRLAPSVSNAAVGDLGQRDLINRAQLLLQGIEITAGGVVSANQGIVIEGVINPSNYPANPDNITWYSLQGTPQGGSVYGTGQPSFSQIAPSTAINFDGGATVSTTISGAPAVGATQITVASTASIAVGDVALNTSRNSLQGNTTVTAIGAGFVRISLPLIAASNNGDTLQFVRNYWANPGETIFSFISSPQSRDSLDLSQLKELTNTPLGGRGCYPNGPDVLFINIYLTQGAPINASVILRWGEAQA